MKKFKQFITVPKIFELMLDSAHPGMHPHQIWAAIVATKSFQTLAQTLKLMHTQSNKATTVRKRSGCAHQFESGVKAKLWNHPSVVGKTLQDVRKNFDQSCGGQSFKITTQGGLLHT